MKQKVLIIGVDGATYQIIRPMIKEGKLPNFERLINTGVSGDLTTTIPSLTPTAFTTLMTGVNPGHHGIFDFAGGVHRDYRSRIILNSSNIHVKTIWEIISEKNKKVISIGVPFTYPPFPVNGIMVSAGMPNPEKGQDVKIFPPEVGKEIMDYIGGIQHKYLTRRGSGFCGMPQMEFYEDLQEKVYYVFEKVRGIFFYLFNKYEWDIFMVHFNLTDMLQHNFWRFIDPGHVSYDKSLAEHFENTIYKGYQDIDKLIGEVLAKTDQETNVIVLSDHGFGPVHYLFNMNYWLEEIGLLKRKKRYIGRYKVHRTTFQRGLSRLGYQNLADHLPTWLSGMNLPVVRRNIDPGGAFAFRNQSDRFAEMIDWKRTRAYADVHGINLNLRGREPEGVIEPGKEQEQVISYIMNQLLSVRDTETNATIIGEVLKKEDIFKGPCTEEATDIYFFFKEGYHHIPSPDFMSKERFTKLNDSIPFSGHHVSHRSTQKGIFLSSGPGMKQSTELQEANMMDIAPTILYLLNLEIPAEMEGRVLREAIDEDLLNKRQEMRIENSEFRVKRERKALSAREEEKIREQLKGLGYL
ncbi:MAG: hypothetical protein A2W23_06855 [Planctomycetes bacterium RBG_16_43_13]|nr:MAG: hypothetical protein A2W23_06855 [Planctomycetes bacterium RBG_16_43_13]